MLKKKKKKELTPSFHKKKTKVKKATKSSKKGEFARYLERIEDPKYDGTDVS
jgi:hypothetical protein